MAYFTEFFRWYNEEHLHTRLGMVTPQQKHDGTWVQILAEREEVKRRTLAKRREINTQPRVPNKEPGAAIS